MLNLVAYTYVYTKICIYSHTHTRVVRSLSLYLFICIVVFCCFTFSVFATFSLSINYETMTWQANCSCVWQNHTKTTTKPSICNVVCMYLLIFTPFFVTSVIDKSVRYINLLLTHGKAVIKARHN